MMELESWWWYGILISLTAACLIAMAGVRSAKQHAIGPPSRRMIVACTIVGIWLVAYLSQQFLFGRERFGGHTSRLLVALRASVDLYRHHAYGLPGLSDAVRVAPSSLS